MAVIFALSAPPAAEVQQRQLEPFSGTFSAASRTAPGHLPDVFRAPPGQLPGTFRAPPGLLLLLLLMLRLLLLLLLLLALLLLLPCCHFPSLLTLVLQMRTTAAVPFFWRMYVHRQ